MCAIVFYKKQINGKTYPKAARTGPYAFAQEVRRVGGRVVTTYIGILSVPDGEDVMESEGESENGQQQLPGEPEQV
jgi:hypothetical protein